jgi:hypothetical protein
LLVNLLNPIPELQHALYPRSVVNQGTFLNYLPFRCFQLKLTFEFIKELGNVSKMVGLPMFLQGITFLGRRGETSHGEKD